MRIRRNQYPSETMTTMLPSFIPVKPSHTYTYDFNKIEVSMPQEYISRHAPLCALYQLNAKTIGSLKHRISTRIVVVGPSLTCISFLETIIFK